MANYSVPLRYIPKKLNKKDTKKIKRELNLSRKMYRNGKYYTRKKVKSFKSTTSNHIINARKIYKIQNIKPSNELVKKTGCSINALKKIVSKGEGAYFSSGSRPNQTPQSWGYARLASSITGGKASAVDFKILEEGCSHNSKALKLAKKSPYFKHGSKRVPTVSL